MESIQTELIPLLKTNFEKLVTISGDVAEQVTDILFLYLGKIYEFLEKHQKELKQISAYLSQISQGNYNFFPQSRALFNDSWHYRYCTCRLENNRKLT